MPSRNKRVQSPYPRKFKSKNQLSHKCINRRCKSGKNLTDAIALACNYYQVTYKKGKKVCAKCMVTCMNHFKRLANKFQNSECIYESKYPNFGKHYAIESSTSEEEEEEAEEQPQPMLNTSRDLSSNEDPTNIVHQVVEKFFIDYKPLINDQTKLCKAYLSKKVDKRKAELDSLTEMSRDLQNKMEALRNKMHELNIMKSDTPINVIETVDLELENCPLDMSYGESAENKTKDIKLENLNIDNDVIFSREINYISPDNLPSIGTLEYPPLKKGHIIYMNMQKINGKEQWSEAEILSVINRYHVNVQINNLGCSKVLGTKNIALYTSSPVRFPVGTRVIALVNNGFYPGVIGEDPTIINKFRYLVFFENGNVQYQQHENIRLIAYKSKCVSHDVHPDLREFIKNYLKKYPTRQMAKLTKDNLVQAKYKDCWEEAKVMKVDASIVKLYFKESKESKWFYRGSLSLYDIYEKQLKSKKGNCLSQPGLAFLNKPLVESTKVEPPQPIKSASQRNTARKNTGRKRSTSNRYQTEQNVQNQHKSYEIKPIQLPDNVPRPEENALHNCDHSCVDWITYNHQNTQYISTLAMPLHYGFERSLELKRVIYKTPCGKTIRDINEMFKFLIMTRSTFTIDQFNFDDYVKPLNQLKILECKKYIDDLSCGRELKSISVVNNISKIFPPKIEYISSRKAMKGVEINEDRNFLCGCDCTDNCQDKSKCACWKLTYEGQWAIRKQNVFTYDETNIGYNYRRLSQCVTTGIYECNKNCKCSSSCLNRVVQFPLSHRLQLFMTEKKGWGVRCLNDIPQGSFVCIYAGYLLTESDANEGGINYGDEYLAELDYIELVERVKKDYESDVPTTSSDEEENYLRDDKYDTSDEDYQSTSGVKGKISNGSDMLLRERKPKIIIKTELNNTDVPSKLNSSNRKNNPEPSKSVRKYFGANEDVYIMDAKTMGNIGRYLNHSCAPNLFVQNVFVDTYDLRFPWISFFAQHYIPAGTELTWDYNYSPVTGKEIHCSCGSVDCRGRLL